MTGNVAIDSYDLPMQEAIDFWQSKMKLTPGEYNKLSDSAKLKAFAVAGIAVEDELSSVFDAINKAIAKGTTFEEFQRDCGDIFAKRGWGSWRIDTVFQTNLQTAYSVGRYEQMQQTTEGRPYWMYVAVGDDRTRPAHMALHEKVFPADHKFWDTWYPPNGFNCRCTVISLSERQVKDKGIIVETVDPTYSLIEPVNASGKTMPARQLIPDKGFAYNPGKVAFGVNPASVKDFNELADGIKNKAGGYLKNSNGFTDIQEKPARLTTDSMMSTNGFGSLTIRNHDFPTQMGIFNPAKELQSAWNKLAVGESLAWKEEYAIETLWHEITHNTQKWPPASVKISKLNLRITEIVTQWTARRTYPDFIKALGGTASHLASIKSEGLGYGTEIRNFDRLLSALKIDEGALLNEMQRLMDKEPADAYRLPLAEWLAKESGHKKRQINKALASTKEDSAKYEDILQKTGLIQ